MIQKRNQIMKNKKRQRRHQLKENLAKVGAASFVLFSSQLTLLSNQGARHLTDLTTVEARGITDPNQFIQTICNIAAKVAHTNDLYASVMIAQAGLESGWGTSALSKTPNYNLFGIKGQFKGQSINMNTLEDNGSGTYYQIKDAFRKYNSYEDSLHDYADVLTGKRSQWLKNYYAGAKKSNTSSYRDATHHLTGRYATDTQYGTKLNQIIDQYNLTQYDTPKQNRRIDKPVVKQSSAVNSNFYTVQPGDGFYRIANRLGVSIEALLQANNLSIDSLIFPNQKLIIPTGSNVGSVESNKNNNNNNIVPSKQGGSPYRNSYYSPASQQTSNIPQSDSGSFYTVRPGDSLYYIASKFGVSLDNLTQANGLTTYSVIHPNQKLVIPRGQYTSSSSIQSGAPSTNMMPQQEMVQKPTVENKPIIHVNTKPKAPTFDAPMITPLEQPTAATYTIVAGDNLYRIANNHGVSLESLLTANQLNYQSVILPGQTLIIPSV